MRVQLKQDEIKEALKQYIRQQGIQVSGKTVEITFTAGRKDTGLSAEVNISDADIMFQQPLPTLDEAKPVLAVVKAEVQEAPVQPEEAPVQAPKASLFG